MIAEKLSSASNRFGHLVRLADVPEHKSVLTVGNRAPLALPKQELARITALETQSHGFYIISLAEAEHSPMWFLAINRCKELGLTFLGHYTIEPSVLAMLMLTTGSMDSDAEAKAIIEDRQVIQQLVSESCGLNWFKHVISTCHDLKASDLHLEIREGLASVRIRKDGVMRRVMSAPPSLAREGLASAFTLLAEERSRSEVAFNEFTPQAAMIPIEIGDHKLNLRYQSHPVVGGLDATLRILRINTSDADSQLDIESLGYMPQQVEALHMAANSGAGGLFLAGVTGSGKTTTLNSLLRSIAAEGLRKIVTIEDPVEYIVKGVSHYSIQRSVSTGKDGDRNPFLAAMMAFLRMDPDVGLFGEIRDGVSAQMAQAAIQTGHKILTTVHATSAISIIGRLCSSSIGLTRDNLCSPGFISGLAYQVLMPVNCPHCRVPAHEVMTPQQLEPYRKLFRLDSNLFFAASDQGCPHCRTPGIDYNQSKRIGVKGVKVAAEVLIPDEHMLSLLLRGDDFGAKRYWRSQRRTGFDDPDMTGKEVWGHALYDMSIGRLDPFYFELTFGAPGLLAAAVEELPGTSSRSSSSPSLHTPVTAFAKAFGV